MCKYNHYIYIHQIFNSFSLYFLSITHLKVYGMRSNLMVWAAGRQNGQKTIRVNDNTSHTFST